MKVFKKLNIRNILVVLLIILIVISFASPLYARAGGAGGNSSSGGSNGGGGIGYLIYFIFRVLPFPFNIIAIVLILIFMAKFGKNKNDAKSPLNDIRINNDSSRIISKITGKNPDFDKDKFILKVKKAFIEIQNAWQNKDLSKVRIFISDGVYQRFNTQFLMMNLLEQRNILENININKLAIIDYQKDGLYDVITVAIRASAYDSFVSKIDSSLSHSGNAEFIEYWTFIKKRGVKEKDIYSSQNCPNCGASLENKLGEVSRCEFCNSITNSGEFDWVLSEITQAEDYAQEKLLRKKYNNYYNKLREVFDKDNLFSIQMIEDKASNAYLQILTSSIKKQPEIMRRFVSDKAFEDIKNSFPKENIVYNRLFLNRVTLIDIIDIKNKYEIKVKIKLSYQRVILENGRVIKKLEPNIVSNDLIMTMVRSKDYENQKGSLYTHNCPNCGGAIGDTIDIRCEYCDAVLNSPEYEWIVDDLEYVSYYASKKGQHTKVDEMIFKDDSIFRNRDYVINNVLIMIAADNKFEQEEIQFAYKIAKKLHFKPHKINYLFDLAKSNKLVLRMPHNKNDCQKIYKLMEKAAHVGEGLNQDESKILDYINENYL